jgi:hypothetical protein
VRIVTRTVAGNLDHGLLLSPLLVTDGSVKKVPECCLGYGRRISSLDVDKPYPVHHAERFDAKYWTSVLLTIRESSDNVIEVSLPCRYSVVFSEDGITAINDKTVQYQLTYKGKCIKSDSYVLDIDP